MATYLVLLNFTEQGIGAIKDTIKRTEAFRKMAKKAGVTVRDFYWTLGQYDGAFVADAPNDESMTAAALSVASLGNVRTQVLRAFDAGEIKPILGRMA